MTFGAPQWFWGLFLIPILILLFARAEQRGARRLHDFVGELQGDRVGLIAFAGRAFVQAPLTIDYSACLESINDIDTKTIPEGGTNISEAITLATTTFGKSAMGNRGLIIFTDGENLS